MSRCSWSLLWLIWIAMVGVLLFCLRGPLRITESIESASSYFNNLTPKFYVALTGTSSLVSGIILIFEWWYFKNTAAEIPSEETSDNEGSVDSTKTIPECKVWRNPMSLFRGAEYARFLKEKRLEPLTYYDMNLSAQDHQNFFICEEDSDRKDYEEMFIAWRERDSSSRIARAKTALAINPECALALILLAEEECETVADAEAMLKRALKAAENTLASYNNGQHYSDVYGRRRRDINMQIYIKRKLAVCARKQGRLREAIKSFKDMSREGTSGTVLNVQENLIEACLEMQAYADVQTLVVRFDGYNTSCAYGFPEIREPRSAFLSYTSALLKVRSVAENFRCSVDNSLRRGLSSAEQTAVEALSRAIEFNPHVPLYLLELRPLIMPPEHYLKRGDTEAIAYAFCHISHWKRIDGALQLLHLVYKDVTQKMASNNYSYAFTPQLETADRELLPSWHKVATFPKKESTIWALFQSLICVMICGGALMIHHYPANSTQFLASCFKYLNGLFDQTYDTVNQWAPSNIISLLASKQVDL